MGYGFTAYFGLLNSPLLAFSQARGHLFLLVWHEE